jgi:hypothetical protein
MYEPGTENPRVGGSIPPLATIQINIKHVAHSTGAAVRGAPVQMHLRRTQQVQ